MFATVIPEIVIMVSGCVIASSGNTVNWSSLLLNTLRYARTNVIGSRTSFVIASVRSTIL